MNTMIVIPCPDAEMVGPGEQERQGILGPPAVPHHPITTLVVQVQSIITLQEFCQLVMMSQNWRKSSKGTV